ncbi:FtsB family cell division protein [Pseudoclavibacter soli]|uniref:FtsB family cell division protein n=1 Tax=Pseudoclavibacter soli TaxID=452623 RepID=UPI0003FB1621|nr:septum formation initiator family protein [Pseudoclavibacter soli]
MARDGGEQGTAAGTHGFRGFPVLLSLALIGVALVLAPSIKLYIEQQQQVADLQAEVDAQSSSLTELQQQRARWDDPAYIRAQTRERLYFVVPGETTYVVVDGDSVTESSTDTQATQAPSTDVTTTQQNWSELLGQSIAQAGTSDAPLSNTSTDDGTGDGTEGQ